jgi:hypothetical protein
MNDAKGLEVGASTRKDEGPPVDAQRDRSLDPGIATPTSKQFVEVSVTPQLRGHPSVFHVEDSHHVALENLRLISYEQAAAEGRRLCDLCARRRSAAQ